jgi:hypothetical protein
MLSLPNQQASLPNRQAYLFMTGSQDTDGDLIPDGLELFLTRTSPTDGDQTLNR